MAHPSEAPAALQKPPVVWDDGGMRSTYANVCNVSSTREEVTVVFGTNQGWKGNGEPLTVALSDRMILSPFAAKRLSLLLNGVIEEYERRYGPLAIERPRGLTG